MSDLNYWCSLMDAGWCLWVGAGLTVQIAGGPQNAHWPARWLKPESIAG